MVTANEVLEYIKQAGPVLPKHVAEAFGISTLFASAFLSELSSKGHVLTSHLKIGGSPLYYTSEHRDRLVDYRGNLHEKEQKTFELLRSERVLDDPSLELLDRVALRKMEDFAVPLAVDVGGERRIFWKYYLVGDDEATPLISKIISTPRAHSKDEDDEAESSDIRESEAREESHEESRKTGVSASSESFERAAESDRESESVASVRESDVSSEPKLSGSPRDSGSATPPESSKSDAPASEQPKPASAAHEAPRKSEAQSTIGIPKPKPVQIKHAPDASGELSGDKLGDRVLAYFEERGIGVLFAEIGKKNTISLGVCRVPSAVGDVEYYFYAKDKKSITDKDVKEAYAESAILGYPLLYLAKGSVHKNATELVGSKLKGCVIVEI